MKKNVFLVAVLTFFSVSAFSQGVSFGVKAGLNVSNYTSSDGGPSSSALIGFHGGAYLTAMFSEHIGLQPELLYSMQGDKYSYNSGFGSVDVKSQLSYISIPVLFRYNVNDLISFHAGPQFGILASAKSKVGSTTTDIKDQLKSTDLGLAFGGTVDLPMGLNFTLRYVIGLSNVDDTGGNAKSTNFQASVGYKLFGSK